jgi:TPR repeat protein
MNALLCALALVAAAAPPLDKKVPACPGGTAQGCVDGAKQAWDAGDPTRHAQLHGLACDAGIPDSCQSVGDAFKLGQGAEKSLEQAAKRFRRGCDLGGARPCVSLGTMTWQGQGVKPDPAAAFKLFIKGCKAGDALGCYSAGICHRTGSCAPKSEAKAAKLLKTACEKGETRACGP